ncbi:MAG: hypothetical protein V9E82_01235 [Candidatus Nanopelagicales bacterium]
MDDHLTRPQFSSIYLDAELQQMGSNATFTHESMNTLLSAPLTGTLHGSICAPDESDASRGVFLVKSSMTVEGAHSRSMTVGLDTLPVTVRQNPSRIVKLKLTREHTFGWGHVEGRAVAQTPTRGRIGAGGTVRLDYLAPDGWRTFHERSFINDVGDFRGSGGQDAHTWHQSARCPDGVRVVHHGSQEELGQVK